MLNNMRLQGYAYLSTSPSVINLPNVRLLSNFRLIVERRTSSSGTEDMVNPRLSFFIPSSSDCAMFGYPSLALMLKSIYNASDTSNCASRISCSARGLPVLCNPHQTYLHARAAKLATSCAQYICGGNRRSSEPARAPSVGKVLWAGVQAWGAPFPALSGSGHSIQSMH